MKRKWLCILLMLAGIATIAGTILLSLGRSEYADQSPVYILIILSIVTITVAAQYVYSESYRSEISGRGMVFLRAYRAVSILAILVCLAFIAVMFFLTSYYTFYMRNVLPLMALAIAGIAAAALCLKERHPISRRNIAKAAAAFVIATALCFVYLNYLPKYSLESSMILLRSDKEYAQKDIFYDGGVAEWGDPELFRGNPFYVDLYGFNCDSYSYDAGGLYVVRGYIVFNPATGAHEYTLEEEPTYSPGDWPTLFYSSNLIYDENGHNDAVLNLYFRKPWGNGEGRWYKSSGEWNVEMKAVMYPNSFPEDEARAFLRSMGEETLKTKLLEQINLLDPKLKDKTIDLFFFGINIGFYQNGEIALKQ